MTRYSAVVFGAGLTIAALLPIIAGFMMIGSPDHVRKQEPDRTRSSELAAISGAVSTYRRTHAVLPAALSDLSRGTTLDIALKDPAGRPYGYVVTGTYTYDLCADFSLPSENEPTDTPPQLIFTRHPAPGRVLLLSTRGAATRTQLISHYSVELCYSGRFKINPFCYPQPPASRRALSV